MDCEICGKREAFCLVYLEGAEIGACAPCARGGKVIHYFENHKIGAGEAGSGTPHFSPKPKSEEEIVEGYGKKIRDARVKSGIGLEELGMKIAEKANYLDHIEREDMLPSLAIARKLEKFFGIRLVETETNAQHEMKFAGGKRELTLIDVVEIERKGGRKKK